MSHKQVGSSQDSIDSIIIFYYYLQMVLHTHFYLFGSQSASLKDAWKIYCFAYALSSWNRTEVQQVYVLEAIFKY